MALIEVLGLKADIIEEVKEIFQSEIKADQRTTSRPDTPSNRPSASVQRAVVSASYFNSHAIKTDGSLWAWGCNDHGQIGDGSTQSRSTPVRVGAVNNWAAVSVGDEFTLALKSDGSLWVCGYNFWNQLGIGIEPGDTPAPVQLDKASDWTTVSAGGYHSLAIKSDGTLWAWGLNSNSQLGDCTTIERYRPTPVGTDSATSTAMWSTHWSPFLVATDSDWVSVSAGEKFSLAIKKDGSLWAWGKNNNGQLGDGTRTDQSASVRIGIDSDWATVSAGGHHSLALKTDGSLWAWGLNSNGQLGDGTRTDQSAYVRIGIDSDWATVSAGGYHSLALKTDGSLWAWGLNSNGQLGDGTRTDQSAYVRIGIDSDWATVSAGEYHSLALKADGTLWVWGKNNNGQLGLGDFDDRNVPTCVGTGFGPPS